MADVVRSDSEGSFPSSGCGEVIRGKYYVRSVGRKYAKGVLKGIGVE
jgi:hypothetical protein